jgi:hypothetical protein
VVYYGVYWMFAWVVFYIWGEGVLVEFGVVLLGVLDYQLLLGVVLCCPICIVL